MIFYQKAGKGVSRPVKEVYVTGTDLTLELMHGGQEACLPGHSYGPAIRDTCLFHYVRSGRGMLRINDRSYPAEAGDMFYIRPGFLIYYEADSSDPWEYAWIGLWGKQLDSFLCSAGIDERVPVFRANEKTVLALEQYLSACSSAAPSKLLVTGCAMAFLHALTEGSQPPEQGVTSLRYIDRAKAYLWTNLYRNVTVSEVAAYLGIDRSYLTALFQKHLSVSPKQYILNLKMKHACRYLQDTDYNITQIAASFGYDDLYTFSHAFKKIMGLSPMEYRKTLKNR